MPREILFEGLSRKEILELPPTQLEQLVLTGEPILFHAGSARILGEFQLHHGKLNVVLAQIEGGGEGVLPALWQLIEGFAKARSLAEVNWVVHAVHCAKPNLKLKRVLERKGFAIRDAGSTTAYCYRQLF